jgi:ATP-binding cassette subfamily B (MDR/TAP) protein 1
MSAAKGAASKIIRLLDSRPTVDAESKEGGVPKVVEGKVELQDIHFRYPTRPSVRVLRGLNITVQPGTYIALVGASGCGKSTVIQLIERFYDPLAGRVLLDGQPIEELNVTEYRKHIALVSQEPVWPNCFMFFEAEALSRHCMAELSDLTFSLERPNPKTK